MGQLGAKRSYALSGSDRGKSLQTDPQPHIHSEMSESQLDTVKERWLKCLELIEKSLPKQTVHTWFLPIIPISFVDNILFLKLQSQFFQDWLDSHYRMVLNQVVCTVFGEGSRIEYVVSGDPAEKTEKQVTPLVDNKEVAVEVEVTPTLEKSLKSHINSRFTLANFFASQENRFAYKAVEYVAHNLATPQYNPLVIHGDIGTGKSHLLHALGNCVSDNSDKACQIYMTGESFLHHYIGALQGNRINKFVNTLRSVDVFHLDNIQFLSGKVKSQEMLLFIFGELIKLDRQVVVSIDTPPNKLIRFNPRLVALLQSGLIADVHKSDRITRESIIRHHLQENEIFLEEKTIQYLSEKLGDNIHQLHAVIVRIVAQISLLGKQLSFDDIRYIVSQLCPYDANDENNPAHFSKQIKISDILLATSKYYDIPIDILQGVSRKQRVITARQTAIYLCRELTDESLNAIGFHFSNLHHASVLYAHKKVMNGLANKPRLKSAIEKIKALL